MKIAVDKNNFEVAKKDNNEYVYLFDQETLNELIHTNLHCVRYDKCEFVDINTTNYNIDCFKKCKITDENWNKLPKFINYKIGIIIPNCNYEHTIRKCLNSILNQTYNNYEIIIIDDCSTDNSLEIEREFAKTYPRIKLVELKQKRYNGGARNEGYLYLSDDVDYVFCIDSDDWLLDKNVLEDINNKLQKNPDVLFMGLSKYKNGKTTVSSIPEYKNKYDALKGWSGVGKVTKKSLATKQECLYKEGTLKEDKNQHCAVCFYMKSFELLKKPVYVWNQSNTKSVTTVRTRNVLWETSTIRHYADTLELYLKLKGQDMKFDEFMQTRVEKTKLEIEKGGDKQW
ncbi:glycosyltransferase family 2 protein [bacterium]|nr:glycosyltransferase family 2 protein [bacterium]